MARACSPSITAAEVTETLNFLVRMKLLKKDGDGNYHQTDKTITMGNMDVVPVAARELQRQMGEFAIKAIDLPLSERTMSGFVLGLTERSYERIRKEMADFYRRVVAIATEDDETERVYRMNMQLFPLSKRIETKKVFKVKKR
jgi:uncharacterized protein (TIGR02147 family)